MGLMERFSDPAYIDAMSMGDKVMGALITTLMGMGITFVVLLLIWGLIAIMTKIMDNNDKTPVAPKASKPAPTAAAPTAPAAIAVEAGISGEIVAAISAAIAAISDVGIKNNLIVRKINRISGENTPWRSAGESECIDSRKF